MPYVIAEPCIDVQDKACVSVCPVACIHFDVGKDRKLYIDPNECIDCGACEPACPVAAARGPQRVSEVRQFGWHVSGFFDGSRQRTTPFAAAGRATHPSPERCPRNSREPKT